MHLLQHVACDYQCLGAGHLHNRASRFLLQKPQKQNAAYDFRHHVYDSNWVFDPLRPKSGKLPHSDTVQGNQPIKRYT